jgi:hypothetical protein
VRRDARGRRGDTGSVGGGLRVDPPVDGVRELADLNKIGGGERRQETDDCFGRGLPTGDAGGGRLGHRAAGVGEENPSSGWRGGKTGEWAELFDCGAGVTAGGEGVVAAEDEDRAAEIANVLGEALELGGGEGVGGLVVDDDDGGGEKCLGLVG